MAASDSLREAWKRLGDSVESSRAMGTINVYRREDALRKAWMVDHKLRDGEAEFLLYLADRASTVGSSALSQAVAAYQFVRDKPSDPAMEMSRFVVAAKKRAEVEVRKPTTMALSKDMEKVWKLLEPKSEEKMERDVLVVMLSWEGLLRASEAAELQWSDLTREGDLYKIKVSKAKNDQQAWGRESFFKCDEGSQLDQLICRWRVRSEGKSSFVFPNLNNQQKLTASAVGSIARRVLKEAGLDGVSHHGLRRGAANSLQEAGVSADEIQKRGRWRSSAGLGRYLKDTPAAQGIRRVDPRAVENGSANADSSTTKTVQRAHPWTQMLAEE